MRATPSIGCDKLNRLTTASTAPSAPATANPDWDLACDNGLEYARNEKDPRELSPQHHMISRIKVVILVNVAALLLCCCQSHKSILVDGKRMDIDRVVQTIYAESMTNHDPVLTKTETLVAATGDIKLIPALTPYLLDSNLMIRDSVHTTVIFLVRVYYGQNINEHVYNVRERQKYEEWEKRVKWYKMIDAYDVNKMRAFQMHVEAWVKEELAAKKPN